jgi:methionyl-tRNA formyltransferase
MKIVFFGTPTLAAGFLDALLRDPFFEVVALVCQPDEPIGRKKVLTPPPTKELFLATHPDRPVFQPTKLKDEAFQQELRALGAEAFVVMAYGRILPASVLNIPPKGCVNVHPSLLPQYRGPSPLQAAIAAGDSETGVSIMRMDEGMDTGPIFAQERFALASEWTTSDLAAHALQVGAPMLVQVLKDLHSGTATLTPQSTEGVSICSLISKQDGLFQPHWSAEETVRKLRAYTPWPGVTITSDLRGKPLTAKIIQAQPAPDVTAPAGTLTEKDGILYLGTASCALAITELQPLGKNAMRSADFLRGWR